MSRKYFKITKCPDPALATANRIIVSDQQGLFTISEKQYFLSIVNTVVLVKDKLIDILDPLALFAQKVFSTGYGISNLIEQNWTCRQFCISQQHPFLATPIFVNNPPALFL